MTKKQKVIAIIAFVLIIVLIALICISLQNKKDGGTPDDTQASASPSESLEPTPEPTPTPLQFTTAPSTVEQKQLDELNIAITCPVEE